MGLIIMLLPVLVLAAGAFWGVKAASLPDKVYGVNLGSWYVRFGDGLGLDADRCCRLVMEPWMLPGCDCYSSHGQIRSLIDWMSSLDRYGRPIL